MTMYVHVNNIVIQIIADADYTSVYTSVYKGGTNEIHHRIHCKSRFSVG
jgi:hypothetical protein